MSRRHRRSSKVSSTGRLDLRRIVPAVRGAFATTSNGTRLKGMPYWAAHGALSLVAAEGSFGPIRPGRPGFACVPEG